MSWKDGDLLYKIKRYDNEYPIPSMGLVYVPTNLPLKKNMNHFM